MFPGVQIQNGRTCINMVPWGAVWSSTPIHQPWMCALLLLVTNAQQTIFYRTTLNSLLLYLTFLWVGWAPVGSSWFFFFLTFYFALEYGLPRWLSGKISACQCRRHRKQGFYPWVQKIPWRRKWQPAPVFLPGNSHGQRSLVGYKSPGCKGWTQLSNWAL